MRLQLSRKFHHWPWPPNWGRVTPLQRGPQLLFVSLASPVDLLNLPRKSLCMCHSLPSSPQCFPVFVTSIQGFCLTSKAPALWLCLNFQPLSPTHTPQLPHIDHPTPAKYICYSFCPGPMPCPFLPPFLALTCPCTWHSFPDSPNSAKCPPQSARLSPAPPAGRSCPDYSSQHWSFLGPPV